MPRHKWLTKSWWCEKVVEVPEHHFDWMAPRWYLIVVGLAYLIGLVCSVLIIVPSQ